MADKTWESTYTKTFGNSSRDFSIGSPKDETQPIKICNAFCNFQLPKLEYKDYIKGMSVTGAENLIRINPLVDTETPKGVTGMIRDPKTTKRKNIFSVYWNGDFNSSDGNQAEFTGGSHRRYDLVDIFLQAPSKFLYMDKRYDMEAGLVFTNTSKTRYVVMVTPMSLSPIDYQPPENSVYTGLFTTLEAMAKNIPSFETTTAVDLGNKSTWSPRMFLPQYDRQKFIRWTDVQDPQISYIVFFSPESALPIPRSFYNNFVNKLSGGKANLGAMLRKPGRRIPTSTLLEVNENISPQPIQLETECKEIVNPVIQATIHDEIELDKKAPPPAPPKVPDDCPEKLQETRNEMWRDFVIAIAVIIVIAGALIALYFWWKKSKSGGNQSVPNTSGNIEMANIT